MSVTWGFLVAEDWILAELPLKRRRIAIPLACARYGAGGEPLGNEKAGPWARFRDRFLVAA